MTPTTDAALLAVAGMAAVTYVARAGGIVLARAMPSTPFFAAFLKHLGSSVIVALVTATMLRGDWAGVIATAVTVGAAARGRPTTGMLAGMATAALLRWAGGA